MKIRSVNTIGTGPWSPPSYSQSTSPDLPSQPDPPIMINRTTCSITFQFSPSYDNGSNIIGFRVYEEISGIEKDYDRLELNHTIDCLLAGKMYRVKVKAKNIAGWSSYSEWSDELTSRVLADRPEMPSNLTAVDGSWNFILLEGKIPFDNGLPIHSLWVQKRIIQPFSKGSWEDLQYDILKIPNDIEIVEYVNHDNLLQKLQEEDQWIKTGIRPNGDYNPFLKRHNEAIYGKRQTFDDLVSDSKSHGLSKAAIAMLRSKRVRIYID